MPFVKLDCGILNSTLWFEREMREVFITALLMAEPREFTNPIPQISVRSLEYTGWSAPPGWYGFVPAASVGILARAQVERESGLDALVALGEPEHGSRTKEFEGRRLIRVDGGFLVLNFMKYRERDYTSAERSRRYRERQSRRDVTASPRDITQAEAEAEAEVQRKKRETRAREERPTTLIQPRRRYAAWEGDKGLYVPDRKHTDFIALRGHPGAEKELLAWYAEVAESWTGTPDPDMLRFWTDRFREKWPPPKAKPRDPTAGWTKPAGVV